MIKVLFITYDFPYPLNSGGKNRAYHLIKYAASAGVEIHLLSFVREGFDMEHIIELEKIGVKSIRFHKRRPLKSMGTVAKNVLSRNSIFKTLYDDPQFLSLLNDTVRQLSIDVVHFESSYTGFYLDKLENKRVKTVLGTENIEHKLYEDLLSSSHPIKRPVISYQAKRLKAEEEKMMRKASVVLAVTEGEASYIRSITGAQVEVVENAVDTEQLSFKFDPKVKKNLLFVGNFLYMPNIEAMKFFTKEILPLLPKDVTSTLVGKHVSSVIPKKSSIVGKEYVDDIVTEYRGADILLFPVQIGGGTNFKLLEAMALGIPIIAFPDRLASLNAHPGKEYLSARDGREFAQRIEEVLANKSGVRPIAENARALVEKHYSWQVVGKKLGNIWKKLA